MPIALGSFIPDPHNALDLHLQCEDPLLRGEVARPWFRAWVRRQLGTAATAAAKQAARRAILSDFVLERPIITVGGTGYGKTRTQNLMNGCQLAAGASALLLDAKTDTLSFALAKARQLGLSPAHVLIVSPRQSAGMPGWNPLATGLPINQIVGDIVSVLHEASKMSWGPRLQDVLSNALIVVGEHGGSLFEVARFLTNDDYRAGLLAKRPPTISEPVAWAEAHSFFTNEFACWGKPERAAAVGPVTNKFREMLRHPFLAPLLCARRNTLDLRSLWQRQGLVVVHLDRTTLGEEGARLLGGMLISLLYRTALRAPGAGPVVCGIDELPQIERSVGTSLCDIVTVARSFHLRLAVAAQHLDQLSEQLRRALLANASQIYFHLGYEDARLVASSLAGGSEERITRVAVVAEAKDRRSGLQPTAVWKHAILDEQGRPLRLSPPATKQLRDRFLFGSIASKDLKALAWWSGVARLYVVCPETGEPVELESYVGGISPDRYWIIGPPCQLVISFPKARLHVLDRASEGERIKGWARCLQELPPRHLVLRSIDAPLGVVQVDEVPDVSLGAAEQAFVSECLRANGQSSAEIEATRAWREQEVARLAERGDGGSRPRRREALAYDGSLY